MNENKNLSPAKWNISFSVMRSLACIAIVVLHLCLYAKVAAVAQGRALSWGQALGTDLVQDSCLWAVPMFVMVSGALLLDPARKMSWQKLWKNYVGRVGGALLLFGLFFIVFDMAMNGLAETAANSNFFVAHPVGDAEAGVGLNGAYVFLCCFIDLLTGHSWTHLWYLYMLLGLYLLLPFFKMVVENSTEKELKGLIVILFLFQCVVPLLGLFGVETDYRFSVATVYPLYFFLGYALDARIVEVPKWLSVILVVLGFGCIWLLVWRDSLSDQAQFLSYGTSYNSIPVVVLAVALFVLLDRKAGEEVWSNEKSPNKLLLNFDKCSLGIYLLHLLFIKLAFRYFGLDPYSQWFIFPLTLLAVIAASWLVTAVLRIVKKNANRFE